MDRREFLKRLFGALVASMALISGWPFLSFLTSPFYSEDKKEKFVKVPDFASIPQGRPVKMTFPYVHKDAFLTQNEFLDVWVIKRSSSKATVYSPMCTHLSCRYDWKEGEEQFACPCHASVFDPKGNVLAGPAPRPLDTLPHKIEAGELFVRWETYKPGIPTKIEA
jgi:menaquinol-cytochrome c reductase iron-sulfur subunit